MDVRTRKQYEEGHIEGAIHIPHVALRERMSELSPMQCTVVYCSTGSTGNATQNILLGNQFAEVYNLSGGYKHYQKGITR